jgi:hypothetical protein
MKWDRIAKGHYVSGENYLIKYFSFMNSPLDKRGWHLWSRVGRHFLLNEIVFLMEAF